MEYIEAGLPPLVVITFTTEEDTVKAEEMCDTEEVDHLECTITVEVDEADKYRAEFREMGAKFSDEEEQE